MTLAVFIVLTIVIGWFVPRLVVERMASTTGVVVGSLAALVLGVVVIWVGSQAFAAAGIGDAQTEFDRGFNAWKIMLLLAPASALTARRAQSSGASE